MQVSIQADARRLPLFRGVREAALGQLLRGAYDQQFPSHVELIREGMPASFLPVGFDERGLPMGMQLIGRPRGDVDLLRLAAAYEPTLPWLGMHP